ncbi:MAG: erythromycin esterase family protein [candidate division Zixibacteria bacterium]|nr:erythromycin esterase family protein [candidate division Zixibacteria bacterium]
MKSFRIQAIITSLCLLLLTGCGSETASVSPSAKAFIDWAEDNAIVFKTTEPGSGFDDLVKFGAIVGDAQVVCLGESRHDAHEQFRLKHRLIEYLVIEKGFTLFALEEGLPYGEKVNQYILGGEGSAEDILSGMGAWYIWDTEEVLVLLKWMRKHNDSVTEDKKVRFCGIDIVDPFPGLVNILGYLDVVDSRYASTMRNKQIGMELFRASFWSEIIERYRSLPPAEVDVLALNISEIVEQFENSKESYITKTSLDDYMLAYRQTVTVQQANEMFTTFIRGTFTEAGDVRERGTTDNILWHLNRHGDNAKMIVWAHNFHVSRDAFDLNIPNRPVSEGMIPMAHYVAAELGDNLVSFGFSFYEDSYEEIELPPTEDDMVDAALNAVGAETFAIDFRKAPTSGLVHDWLNEKQKLRGQGGVAHLIPSKSFDAMIFTRHITKSIMTPRARTRFEAMR